MTYEMKPIAGKSVLFVMAADAEYGVFLRTRISPLMTGVGPVEAAVVLTKELARLSRHDDLPDLVDGGAVSLQLDLFEPAGDVAERRPVIVWIHGGALVKGSSREAMYDGARLAKQGLVVVSINYRLGADEVLDLRDHLGQHAGVDAERDPQGHAPARVIQRCRRSARGLAAIISHHLASSTICESALYLHPVATTGSSDENRRAVACHRHQYRNHPLL